MSTTRIGLVGYGGGGRFFHAPFIDAADGVELAGIVARSPEKVKAAYADWPDVPVYGSLADLLDDGGCDAVTITTPPDTRRELVLEALSRGHHVLADKPFAPDAATARELAEAAERAGLVLDVYLNRRWDADFRTLAGVVERGGLGDLWRVHSRFELDEPGLLDAGPAGGLLRDLGSHLVDQMLVLLGPVASVDAHLDVVEMPGGRTDAGFVVSLRHTSGVTSWVEATKLNGVSAKEYRAYGSRGSYVASGTDVQPEAIFRGERPAIDPAGWGFESREHWGRLTSDGEVSRVPSEQGCWQELYRRFGAAVRGEGPDPVPASDGVALALVLDAAAESARTGSPVTL